MPRKANQRKSRRNTPAPRHEELIAATLRCLKKYGHEGVSIRRISTEAGVSIGLIKHHFPSESGLIALTYETLALSLQRSTRAFAAKRSTSPRERLSRFFAASFAPDLVDPEPFNVWLVFRSLIAHSPEIRALHASTYAEYPRILETLLADLGQTAGTQKFKLRRSAIGLAALLDGLWIEFSLSPETLKASAAVSLCEDWVDALCSGSFPRLLSRPRLSAQRQSPGER